MDIAVEAASAPPADPALWAAFLVGGRPDLKALVRRAAPSRKRLAELVRDPALVKKSIRGTTWQTSFVLRLMSARFRACVRSINAEQDHDAYREKMSAFGDALVAAQPKDRTEVGRVLLEDPSSRLVHRLVRVKANMRDVRWLVDAYDMYFVTHAYILEEAVSRGLTEVVTAAMRRMTVCLCYTVAGEAFHRLDADLVVRAAVENNLGLHAVHALANHQSREALRRSDPSVPPLPRSFYDYFLSQHCEQSVFLGDHGNIMMHVQTLVIMRDDGRITDRQLDDATDRVFSLAGNHHRQLYSYLLNRGNRGLDLRRLQQAVVPMALAGGRVKHPRAGTEAAAAREGAAFPPTAGTAGTA